MTPTLMEFPAPERARMLSHLANRYLPTPGIDPLPDVTPEDALVQERILEEIKAILKLSSVEEPEAQTAMLEYLSNSMSNAVLEDADLRAIESRLGQRGALPISSYKIKVPRDFAEQCPELSLSRKGVRNVILNADSVQHLHLKQGEPPETDFSFFVKHSASSNDRFTVFVAASRESKVLTASDAWRIYHEDVEVGSAQRPIDFLRAFVATYGQKIRVGTKSGKLIADEFVPVSALSNEARIVTVHEESDNDKTIIYMRRVRGLVRRGVYVQLAYSVNLRKYRRDLRRHGVNV